MKGFGFRHFNLLKCSLIWNTRPQPAAKSAICSLLCIFAAICEQTIYRIRIAVWYRSRLISSWATFTSKFSIEKLERAIRFELTTLTLARLCSTPELRPLMRAAPRTGPGRRRTLLRIAIANAIESAQAFYQFCAGEAPHGRHTSGFVGPADRAGH